VITHSKVSAVSDGGDAGKVRPSDWNADHVLAAGYFLPRIANLNFNNDEIINLPTTPLELIAAPGANKIILPIACVLSTILNTASYGNIGDTLGIFIGFHLQYQPVFAVPQIALAQSFFASGGLINLASDNIQRYSTGDVEVTVGLANDGDGKSSQAERASNYFAYRNQALRLYVDNYGAGYDPNLGIFTGGDPANTLKVTVIYHIIDL
jgi:hypothetical protein